MKLGYPTLKRGSGGVRDALATARSARNRATRAARAADRDAASTLRHLRDEIAKAAGTPSLGTGVEYVHAALALETEWVAAASHHVNRPVADLDERLSNGNDIGTGYGA